MRKVNSFILMLSSFIFIYLNIVFSQEKTSDKISGLLFGDYYYKVKGSAVWGAQDFQAFQIRRLYLYYDHIFNDNFSSQILFEGSNTSVTGEGKYGIFLKTAFLEWKNVIPNSSFLFGLIPTPTWSLVEKYWSYRSIEKTIIDMRGYGSGSDLGIGLRGKFDNEGMFNYSIMIGNGNAQKPENNKYKKYYLGLNVKPVKELIIEGYFDYEPLGPDENKTLLKGMAAYQMSNFTLGIEAMQQTYKKPAVSNTTPFGISGFLVCKFSDNLNAFARFDTYNPNTNVSNSGFNENFIVFGVDYMPIKDAHFMPNLWINTYSDKSSSNTSKDSDIMARLTFYYTFR